MNPITTILASAFQAALMTFGAFVVADFADKEVRAVLLVERSESERIIEQMGAKLAPVPAPSCESQPVRSVPALCPEAKPITLTKTVVQPRTCPAPAKCTLVTALFAGLWE